MAAPPSPSDLSPRDRGERAVRLVREGAFHSLTTDELYDRLLDLFLLLHGHRIDFGGPSGTWEAVRTYVDAVLAHYRADIQFVTGLEALTPGRSTRERTRRSPPSLDSVFHFAPGTIDNISPTDVGRIAGIVVEQLAPDLSDAVPAAYRTQRAPSDAFDPNELRRIVREELTRTPPRPEIRREGGIVFRMDEARGGYPPAPPEPEEELPPPPPEPPTPENEAAEVAKPPSVPIPGVPKFPAVADVATYSRRELEAFFRILAQLEAKGVVPPADVVETARKRWTQVFHFPPPGIHMEAPPPPPARAPSGLSEGAEEIRREAMKTYERISELTPTQVKEYVEGSRSKEESQPSAPPERPTLEQLTAEALRPQYLEDFVTWPMIVRTLQQDVRTRNFSRCYLFAGPAGVGKTSLAFAIPRTYLRDEGKRRGMPELGAPSTPIESEGVAVFSPDQMAAGQTELVRTRIAGALSTRPFGAAGLHRFVILDDVGKLSAEAQDALNRVLEKFAGHSTVIITANADLKSLQPGLRSRCAARTYPFGKLKTPDIVNALLAVAKKNDLQNPRLEQLAQTSAEQGGGDLRAALDIFLSDLRSESVS